MAGRARNFSLLYSCARRGVFYLRGMQNNLPPVIGSATGSQVMHEIDYQVFGDDMQFVEIELDPSEAVVAEAGGMMFMDDGIEMETIFGDGSQQNSGFLGSLMGAGKRLLTGESLFMTVFQNRGVGKRKVAFGAPYPGKIIPVHLAEVGGEIWAQKDAFLCAAKGVSVGIAFNKKIGAGLFGGEGFIMERLQGDGWAFMHAGGTIIQRQLAPGETLRVDTGCVVAFQPSVDFDIQYVGKIKTALFGGEGLFFATLRGPGRVWLQSLPFSRLADRKTGRALQEAAGAHQHQVAHGDLGGINRHLAAIALSISSQRKRRYRPTRYAGKRPWRAHNDALRDLIPRRAVTSLTLSQRSLALGLAAGIFTRRPPRSVARCRPACATSHPETGACRQREKEFGRGSRRASAGSPRAHASWRARHHRAGDRASRVSAR